MVLVEDEETDSGKDSAVETGLLLSAVEDTGREELGFSVTAECTDEDEADMLLPDEIGTEEDVLLTVPEAV